MSSGKRKLDTEKLKSASNEGKRRKVQTSNENPSIQQQQQQADDRFLKSVFAHILPASIEKARMEIFITQLNKFGGHLMDKLDCESTHLVVADNMEVDRMCRLLKLESPPGNVCIVKTAWLSSCFRQKTLVDTREYEIDVTKYVSEKEKNMVETISVGKSDEIPSTQAANADLGEGTSSKLNPIPLESKENIKKEFPKVGVMWRAFKRPMKEAEARDEGSGDSDSDYAPSDGEEAAEGAESDSSEKGSTGVLSDTSPHKKLPRGHWVCAQSSKNPLPDVNKHITEKLEEMVKTYQSTNDRWRALSYQKAIQALRKQPKAISSWEEAKGLPGVGARLADKIWEIAESGELRKLNEFRSNEELQVINLFTDVWGAGAHTARTWYQQGFRSLEDLRNKANLTKQQKIGLRCYDDFLDRMPRSEVEEIEKTVKDIAEEIVPGTRCEVCGSYRRGKPTCGDIDILITHPDGNSHKGIFAKILGRLREQGFLTDDLVSGEENGNQKKYMGVFKLHGENRKHRRIDIIVTPVEEYACALVHFTGSAHFNRSIRHLAKEMGMSLSEHALRTGVIRKGGEKVYEGTALPTPTEESIFQHMGIPHRPPEERDH